MAFKDDLIQHIVPATAGAGVMYSFGEHLLFSVLTGVIIYFITNGLSFLIKKIACKFFNKNK